MRNEVGSSVFEGLTAWFSISVDHNKVKLWCWYLFYILSVCVCVCVSACVRAFNQWIQIWSKGVGHFTKCSIENLKTMESL